MLKQIKKLAKKEQSAILEFQKQLEFILRSNLVSLRLFGSKVSGKDTKDSDIDIFVLIKRSSPAIKNEVIDLAFEVNLQYGVYISPRVVSLNLFNNPVFQITPFIKNVIKEGVKL